MLGIDVVFLISLSVDDFYKLLFKVGYVANICSLSTLNRSEFMYFIDSFMNFYTNSTSWFSYVYSRE